ncbi:MAG: glucosaminidase domain-containing protein [Bacteroidota bacterium]
MNISKVLFTLFFITLILHSCGTKRKAFPDEGSKKDEAQKERVKATQPSTKVSVKTTRVEEKKAEGVEKKATFDNPIDAYIWEYAGIAQEEMKLYGIPASITIAQGILESSSGQGELTLKSNNHFGIKCNGWDGEAVYHDDDELQECFRKYNDPKYSFRDHSLFLYERPRYAFLFDYNIQDYKAWAVGLRRAGYATDKKYPDKLISLIERYNLDELDAQVVEGTPPEHFPKPNVRIDYDATTYKVQHGDTLYRIASKFNLTVDELKKLNDLKDNTINIGQVLKLK